MLRPEKLDSLEKLENHINAFAEKHGTDFTYDKFRLAMDMESSALKMTKWAKCDYKTMRKWRAVYTVYKLDEEWGV